jgi:hypothetical protein
MEKDSFQTSPRTVNENLPIWWVVFLHQSLNEATNVVAEDHGTIYPKKCFQNIILYSAVANSDIILYKISSFNLEARSYALSFDRERSQMRSFYSSWLNNFGSEVLSSGTYQSSEVCWMDSGEELSSPSICSKNASPFSGGSGTGKFSSWGTLGVGIQFYAYSLLRNQQQWHNKNSSHQHDSLAPTLSQE